MTHFELEIEEEGERKKGTHKKEQKARPETAIKERENSCKTLKALCTAWGIKTFFRVLVPLAARKVKATQEGSVKTFDGHDPVFHLYFLFKI